MNFIRSLLLLTLACVLIAAEPAATQAKKLVAEKKYDAAVSLLETSTQANPKSVELQKAMAETLTAKGDSIMYDDSLPPRSKYPDALRLYRRALTYDKSNETAKKSADTIEAIYKSMGRPIPQ
jgi:thioredoxin-like negative regulator of GroEL